MVPEEALYVLKCKTAHLELTKRKLKAQSAHRRKQAELKKEVAIAR